MPTPAFQQSVAEFVDKHQLETSVQARLLDSPWMGWERRGNNINE